MSLKTDYDYNEDDFVQHGETISELTVSITLSEYRNLISEQTRLETTVDRLENEKAELVKQLDSARQLIAVCKMPDWVRAIGNALAHWGEDDDGDEGEEKENAE